MKKVSKKELIDIKKTLIIKSRKILQQRTLRYFKQLRNIFRFKEKIVLGKQLEVIKITF